MINEDPWFGDEIRATSDIKIGQEITINYFFVLGARGQGYAEKFLCLRKREIRQFYLLDNHGFICECDLCQSEVDDFDHGTKDSEVEDLIKEMDLLRAFCVVAGCQVI